ncbi:hypothetical protein JKP88DRAFT_288021 [Tribonema minus]|uniref:Uncharacterized protein n=1 Tax=Tribonema minus TaxID=303371 RepID=A0A836CJK4_9STRA|nr:hypothetical protein JKP88DRAFT_288021 [Tribonema minus]
MPIGEQGRKLLETVATEYASRMSVPGGARPKALKGIALAYCETNTTTSPYYRTVMAYSCTSAGRVPYFSSPSIVYNTLPTGTATITVLAPYYDYVSSTVIGQNTNYYDTTVKNQVSSAFRGEQGVDTTTTTLQNAAATEWVQYTQAFPGGYYDVSMVASCSDTRKGKTGTVSLKVFSSPGVVAAGTATTTLSFVTTQSLSTYATKKVATNVYIPGGTMILRLTMGTGNVNIKQFSFLPPGAAADLAPAADPYKEDFAIPVTAADALPGIAYENIFIPAEIPSRAFNARSAIEWAEDMSGTVHIDAEGRATDINEGSSMVLTVDVQDNDSYQVSFSLSAAEGTGLRLALARGRAPCTPAIYSTAAGGRVDVKTFNTGSSHNFNRVQASPIALLAGEQTLTLCFIKAQSVTLGSICMADSCIN